MPPLHTPAFFQQLVEKEIQHISLGSEPSSLYDPIRYMISLGGKRLRPALLLMSNELFGGDYTLSLQPALGIEVFHNFTLLHDDIMDKAPLRRAKSTVHQKWNQNIAILSGDTMFVKSCQLMTSVNPNHQQLSLDLFFKTAIEVCEGQQLDMDFEQQSSVSINEYIEMIGLKTAVLLACALQLGAIYANASEKDQLNIYRFGKNLGIAFQLQDDVLDVYGDEKKFGKQNSGDILSNKKTFLLLKAFETANGSTLHELSRWFSQADFDPTEKISAVKTIYDSLNIKQATEKEIEKYFYSSLENLKAVSAPNSQKIMLQALAIDLMKRDI
jgi:geranylgeranyl diphosphate synthase type II